MLVLAPDFCLVKPMPPVPAPVQVAARVRYVWQRKAMNVVIADCPQKGAKELPELHPMHPVAEGEAGEQTTSRQTMMALATPKEQFHTRAARSLATAAVRY